MAKNSHFLKNNLHIQAQQTSIRKTQRGLHMEESQGKCSKAKTRRKPVNQEKNDVTQRNLGKIKN